jgi:hypothetical protein
MPTRSASIAATAAAAIIIIRDDDRSIRLDYTVGERVGVKKE